LGPKTQRATISYARERQNATALITIAPSFAKTLLPSYDQHVVIITFAYCPCAKLKKVFSVVNMLALHAVDLGFNPDYFQTIK
jgi:hypothetical protein